ncbi:MAG TPA: tRNA (adenosine(37)-N6)-threonylcarbamoyltransferase complex ATPase subunit type 1 TsaE [Sedimenticola thiotaurini]|uniref:tRNA threonylcarbamoyladenosine biosynthesis protein TsaE n=1 Tax=Sedimenticola thiotaurini TaxID=1543721 RepID=A0A831RM75_9GAMM|nr:tRNA (adenosine(37)-N6)-threonylcarbamoyltransferase complex ATPase subunit type 1 TsaE [Sedimenticola thiotaurini]
MLTLEAAGEREQEAVGAALAACLKPPCIVYLEGDLGAGKTTLVRGLLRAGGYDGAVRSPTYTLMEPYPLPAGTLWHLDLYRLGDPEELEYLGLRDLLQDDVLLLVEWPGRGRGVLPPADLVIRIGYLPGARQLRFEPVTARGGEVVADLARLLQHKVKGSA